MQCEMCGETIRGAPKLVRVEGAELQVCSKCEKFGTEVQQVRRTDLVRPSRSPARAARKHRQQPRPRTGSGICSITWKAILSMITHERIRKARMEKGLSQKDLAMQMKEKEHLIQKIENQRPDPGGECPEETGEGAGDPA